MVTTERTIEVAPGDDLDRLLTAAEADGARLVLVREGVRYRVEREEAGSDGKADIFANYDPERARQALRESAGALSHLDAEAFKAEMRSLRGQDSHARPGDE
jgi:ABC-type Zn uptake system ZnuABC Zn-binding protein ZnuA